MAEQEYANEKQDLYETHNIGHCFHTRLSFADALRDHKIKEVPANEWIVSKLDKIKAEGDLPLIDFFFLIKHKNAGKIESHLWFFKGFCSYLNPLLTQLIDVGTLPCERSISRMALYMDMEP